MLAQINPSFLSSPSALRIGFKSKRIISTHEETQPHPQPKVVPNTLAYALEQGFQTALSPDGLPLLIHPDGRVLTFDNTSETFIPSSQDPGPHTISSWGCVAPVFPTLIETPLTNPTITSFAAVNHGALCYEPIPTSRLDELHQFMEPQVATGFITGEDSHRFNDVLTAPLSIPDLRSRHTFHHVFPEDDSSAPDLFPIHAPYEKDDVGRIILSYRHQSYARNRISFDDWLCAAHSIEHVIKAYGWTRVRLWTDARLREYAKRHADLKELPWAEIGLDPYFYGPVVVLNLSRKASISERFWLTVERKTGAHFYGAWLTDDCGDSFFYHLPKGDELYARALVTSVSTSQGVSWTSDREEVLEMEWDELGVVDVEGARRMLREGMTFEAREDFVDEELLEIRVAAPGETLQWCGDVEALIDPPSLMEVFGGVGEVSERTRVEVIETGLEVEGTRVMVVVFEERDGGRLVWIAKRVYVDGSGEIRARSVPRLVDADYGENILKFEGTRRVDVEVEKPAWLIVGGGEGGGLNIY